VLSVVGIGLVLAACVLEFTAPRGVGTGVLTIGLVLNTVAMFKRIGRRGREENAARAEARRQRIAEQLNPPD
jgi:hypothetical protein